ncbi:MAG TPA: hypothetical protein PLL66_03180 [Bacteroidales bacterium]|nr:hypothetical protein [Bacteroidales bacterium]
MKKKNQKINKKKRIIKIPIKITEETGYNVTFKFENGKGQLIDSYGKNFLFLKELAQVIKEKIRQKLSTLYLPTTFILMRHFPLLNLRNY